MNKIEIKVNNPLGYLIKIKINLDLSEITVNEKVKYYEKNDLFPLFMKILEITENWKDLYEGNRILDATNFKLVIEYNNQKKSFVGKGEFPDNFDKLMEIVTFLEGDINVN